MRRSTTGAQEGGVVGPHQEQPVAEAGPPLQHAGAAVVMVHGRGATAEGMLALAGELDQPEVAYRAPQASGRSWYPFSFLAPVEQNEPGLSSGLQAITDVLRALAGAGLPPERTVLLGFSQGACLTLEFAARHPRRYGGVIAWSGGLIGTGEHADREPPEDKRFAYEGSLAGTPVFLGCSDRDPHIPIKRVHDTAAVMRRLKADLTERIYPGLGHTVNEDELAYARSLLARLVRTASES